MEYETISELIKMLEQAKEKHGDLPYILTGCYGSTGDIIQIVLGNLPATEDKCIYICTDICSG